MTAATNVIPLRFAVPDPRDTDDERERFRQRYRLYAYWPDGTVKTWAQETPEQVGAALCTLSEEGEFEGDVAVGVLDTKGLPRGAGVWIVSPYTSARS